MVRLSAGILVQTPNDPVDIQPPQPYWQVLQQEIKDLKNSNRDPISFAVEAIRLNLSCAGFKDEVILFDAMKRLESLQAKHESY